MAPKKEKSTMDSAEDSSAHTSNTHDHHHPPADFSLEKLKEYWTECLDDQDNVNLDKYILGYEELYKFLNLLGTVFGWVASDVKAKLDILIGHRKGAAKEHYEHIEMMMKYEIEKGMIKYKAKDSATGSRNLLRLHRALEYINHFLEQIPDLAMDAKCCHVSQEAYKKTLLKYHPWVVQKAAMLAMHMLPTKEGLIHKICADSEEEFEKAKKLLPEAVAAMTKVYDRTQVLYKEKGLLDLP